MHARARPTPILSPLHQSGTHRVKRNVAQRRCKMLFVHGDRAEPPLLEVARPLASRLDRTRVGPVHARKCATQPVRGGRNQDEMNVVRHQAPSPHTSIPDAGQFAASRAAHSRRRQERARPLPR